MSNPQDDKQNNNMLGKVLAGAAVVGAGVVAAKVLSDEDNRKKIGEGLQNAKDKGMEAIGNMKDDAIARITAAFEDLKKQIENSQQAKDLQDQLTFISNGLNEIKSANEDDVNDLVEKIGRQVEKLKEDFEARNQQVS